MALDMSNSQMDVTADGPRQDGQVQGLINSHLSRIGDVSAHSASSSIREALELLDDEMNVLQNVLALVATRRNAISQNSRLPPEILSRVFQSTADIHRAMDPAAYPNIGKRRAWAGWLEVIHVCRRWREVALKDLTLWTELTYTTSLPWLEQILDRVQGAPVTLHRHITGDTKREFEVINNHLSHIRELVIILEHETAYFELCQALTPASLSNPAPLLESVTFATRCDGVPLDSEWEEELVIPLPETFFSGEVPALRRIALRSYRLQSMSSSHFIKDSITHFELKYPRKPLYETPGTEFDPPERNNLLEPRRAELLTCLGRLPVLEVLRLADCFPRITNDPWPTIDVCLGHLRHLQLKGDEEDCARFLERVAMPPSASLSMVCSVPSPESEDTAASLSIVPALLAYIESVSSAYHITALAFQVSNCNPSLRMHMWRTPAGAKPPASEEAAPFLTVDFTSSFGNFDTLSSPRVASLCGGLQLPDLRVLGVFSATMMVIHSTWESSCFSQLFSRFAGAAHLVVNPRTAGLVHAAIAEAEPGEPVPLLDQLTTLSVVCDPASSPSMHVDERKYMEELLISLGETMRGTAAIFLHSYDGMAWQLRDAGIVPVRAHPADGRKYWCGTSPQLT